ncbi:hypothetical protein [Streptomyces tremellae]|uniref:hypothetical protein n=1 Tax=Streptomyces tremellae TaxID=1124239 RepID=UPI0031EFFC95
MRHSDGKNVRLAFPAGGPVLELAGGRYTGKTAITRYLYDAYSQRIPLSRVDLASPGFGHPGLAHLYEPGAEGTQNASPVSDLLYYLESQLRRRPSRFGQPLEFPRLVHGLTAISGWEAGAPAELGAARARLDGVLTADRGAAPGLVETWTNAVVDAVGALTGLASLASAVKALVPAVTESLFRGRTNHTARKWWARQNVAPNGDGIDQLVQLAVEFRDVASGGRTRAQQYLATALLADVSDHYGPLLRFDGVHRPLVLLDNVHDRIGAEVMELLLEGHRRLAVARHRNHLVVIVTALGDGAGLPPLSGVGRGALWAVPEHVEAAGPEAWWLPVEIDPVGPDEIMRMFRDTKPATRLVDVIARVSAGRAGVAHALVRATAPRIRAGDPPPAGELLDLPAAGRAGPTVAESLLRSLVPDATTRDRLIHYAPALSAPDARHLARGYPDGASGSLAADEARQRLISDHWPSPAWPRTAGPFVGNPTLRTLLLHELRALPAWEAIHHRLLTRLDSRHPLGPGAHSDDIRYLHHALALGSCDVVVRSLHRLYTRADACAWLKALNLVCAAPQPKGSVPPADPAGCPACGPDGLAVHRTIDRLVRGLWALSSPLAVPDERTISRITLDLGVLATNCPPESHAVYFDAYTTWPPLLWKPVQAPDLPIPEGCDP